MTFYVQMENMNITSSLAVKEYIEFLEMCLLKNNATVLSSMDSSKVMTPSHSHIGKQKYIRLKYVQPFKKIQP